MSGREALEFTFVCQECGERLQVDAGMKEALVQKGCVVCGAPARTESFLPAGDAA